MAKEFFVKGTGIEPKYLADSVGKFSPVAKMWQRASGEEVEPPVSGSDDSPHIRGFLLDSGIVS